ncbi:MAG: PH domain-containing protein [Patulibacter sp.]|nr:PH domain-containing protein [Patulibacter sp.]
MTTNHTPATTPEAIKALLNEKLDGKLLVRKEIRRLPELMDPGEALITACSGIYEGHNGLLALTDRRILFVDEGVVRSRLEEFHYSRISSAQRHSKLMSASVTFITSGNKATIKDIPSKDRADEIVSYVSRRITGDTERPTAPQGAPSASAEETTESGGDPLATIKQLTQLRDAGALSDTEFEAKKAELLGRI